MNGPTEVLAQRAARGDRAAFEALIALHGRTFLAVARSGGAGAADAEEIFQEAALRIWRKTDTLEKPDRFVGWACAIVSHVARDRARREKVRRTQPLPERAATAGGMSERRRERILAAVASLPHPLCEVIELCYFGGLTYKEIAAAIGMSVPTVNVRLSQARAQLKTLLREEGPE